MPVYFSADTLDSPLSQTTNSRFAVHLAAINEPHGTPLDERFRNLDSAIHNEFGCYLSDICLTCPLQACRGDLRPNELNSRLPQLQHPSITAGTPRHRGE